MIDFHAHILPRMDDGSHRMAETQKMLKMEYDLSLIHIYREQQILKNLQAGRYRLRLRELLEKLCVQPRVIHSTLLKI